MLMEVGTSRGDKAVEIAQWKKRMKMGAEGRMRVAPIIDPKYVSAHVSWYGQMGLSKKHRCNKIIERRGQCNLSQSDKWK